jgi:hypothetical protein
MNNIRSVYGVPELVFICWFGDTISDNRLAALNSLVHHIGVPHILVTDANVHTFVKPDHPLHEAWPYLSGVHKSDYIRAYLLHHYGGGYHDVKYRSHSWRGQWEAFANDRIWIKGRREQCPGYIGYDVDRPHETRFVQAHYHDLVTMGWVICRPHTPYTRRLLEYIESKLDFHLPKLRMYPSVCSSGYYANRPFDKVPSDQAYPLRWLELMGEKFHLLMWEYKDHIEYGLPDADPCGYK